MRGRIRRAVLIFIPLLLLLAGGLSFFRPRRDAPPLPGRSAGEIEQILDDVVHQHAQEAAKGRHPQYAERNERMWMLLLKGRMLALAYPDVMEVALRSRATDASLEPQRRRICIRFLGELSKSGRPSAALTIRSLAESPDRAVSGAALDCLSEIDLQGEHRALYLSRCGDESWDGFEAVALWNDLVTVQEMERIVAASPTDPQLSSGFRLDALNVLKKLRILSSPDWVVQIDTILAGPGDPEEQFRWALKVARARLIPGVLEFLRLRLDRTENPPPDDHPWMKDVHYDEALIAYAELGGELNEIEKERLYQFGYWGDFRKRLEELLALRDAGH
jgi:hypothetical protein